MFQRFHNSRTKTVLRPICNILWLILFWSVCCTTILILLLDQNTPGNLISWRLVCPIIVPSILVALWLLLGRRSTKNAQTSGDEASGKRHFTHLSKRRLVLLIVSLIAITIAILIGDWQCDEHEKRDLLKTASTHFVIGSHPDVSKGQENSTVIELERMYRHLSDLIPAFSAGSPIQVYIFPNIAEMRSTIGRSGSNAGLTWCSPDGPVIYLLTERESSIAENSKTATPGHEMVHATVCTLIGNDYVADIPKWFHEGMAEYESRRGWGDRMMERISIRIFVLWNRDDVMKYPAFDSYDPVISDTYDKIFYTSSFEFMRYIISKSDHAVPWEIVEDVGEGQPFELAFQNAVDDTPGNMYQKWINSFYGVLD